MSGGGLGTHAGASFIEALPELWDCGGERTVRRLVRATGSRRKRRFWRLWGQDGRENEPNEKNYGSFGGARRRGLGSACQTPQQQNALVGGALGAGTGALIGSAVSGGSAGRRAGGRRDRRWLGRADRRGRDAAAGLLRRAGYGGPPPGRCAQWAYDYNGNRVCTAFY